MLGGIDIPKKMIALLLITILITASTSFAVSQYLQGNNRPVAIIDVDLTNGNVPLTAIFSSESYDPDGTIKKVEWKFGDGAISTKKIVEHRYESKGRFTVLLTVWDDDGESATDTIDINVGQKVNPIAVITADHTYGLAPLSVTFHGEGFDDDGYVTSYYWDFDDGTTSIDPHPTHSFSNPGTYMVSLNVLDDDGLIDKTFIEITVIANQPPIASASSNKIRDRAPALIHFTGDVKDSDSDHHEYQWFFENQLPFQNDTSTERNCSHWFIKAGTYKVELTVTDDDGGSDSDVIIIEVYESAFVYVLDFLLNVTSNPKTQIFLKGIAGIVEIFSFLASLFG